MKRICKKCGKEKEIEEFVKGKSCRNGYGWLCKKCVLKRQIKYRAKPEIKIKIKRRRAKPEAKAKRAKYREKPEVKIKYKRYRAKYREKPEVKVMIKKCRVKYCVKPEAKAMAAKRSKKHTKKLSDCYVKNLLAINGINRGCITPEMIELKRELLTFHRLQKELTNGINSRGDQRT